MVIRGLACWHRGLRPTHDSDGTLKGGQLLSAQLSLENPKEGATLAAHLPGVEQKIVQQHGLNASVRLAGGFDGTAGGGY